MHPPSGPLTFLEAVDGYYLTLVFEFFYEAGVIDALCERRTAASIASEFGLDGLILTGLLNYVVLRSDLLIRQNESGCDTFQVASQYRDDLTVKHVLDQYVGGYGPCLNKLGSVLRQPSEAKLLVDLRRHARAFSHSRRGNVRELIQLVECLEVNVILDIGCGGGQLLAELGERNPDLCAIGVDSNAEMVSHARLEANNSGLLDRVEFICGDWYAVASNLSEARRHSVDIIVAVSVLNAYFGGLADQSITVCLSRLQSLFPNRILLACDYFGRLDSGCSTPEESQRTLIHDVAQLVSGQGVPPQNIGQWEKIYAETSCTLLQAWEGLSDGIAWFIHLIQL